MKIKVIKKMIAVMIAASTIATMPGLASAMKPSGNNKNVFLNRKRAANRSLDEEDLSSYEEHEESSSSDEENYEMNVEEDKKAGNKKGLFSEYQKLEDIVSAALDGEGYPDDNTQTDLDNLLKGLQQCVNNGGDKKRVAEIVLKLVRTHKFCCLYKYRLNRYNPEVKYALNVLNLLKMCQFDLNARPVVLEAAKSLCHMVSDCGGEIENSIDENQALRKYKDLLQDSWIKSSSEEEKKCIMDMCSKNFSEKELQDLARAFRGDVVEQNGRLISAVFDILNYCCEFKDSQLQILNIIKESKNGGLGERILRLKSSEALDILNKCLNNQKIQRDVLCVVQYLSGNNCLENNDDVNAKIGNILNRLADNEELTEELLYAVVKWSKNDESLSNFKPAKLDEVLVRYAKGYLEGRADNLKFAEIVAGLIQKKLLEKNPNETVFSAVVACLEKTKFTQDFARNFDVRNDLHVKKLKARSEAVNVFADLVNYGWFDNCKDDAKTILLICENLSNVYAENLRDNLNDDSVDISNDKLGVSKAILALANKDLLRPCFESDQSKSFKQNILSIMNVCSNDSEAVGYVVETIKFLLEQDKTKNSRNFVEFIEDNILAFTNILLRYSREADDFKIIANCMKYVFSDYVKTHDKDELAKVMQQQVSDSTDLKVEDRIIEMLRLCVSNGDYDAVKISVECFEVLFDNYFKENDSKETASRVLELLRDLSQEGKLGGSFSKFKVVSMFKMIASKFDYNFSKSTMIEIMFNCVENSGESREVVAEILKELIVEKGRLDEYFVSNDQPNEGDGDKLRIFDILKTCSKEDDLKLDVINVVRCILEAGKLDGNVNLQSRAFKVLNRCVNNDEVNNLIVKNMLSLLDKYGLPTDDNEALENLKKTLAKCATSFKARDDVRACIDKLIEKGAISLDEGNKFKGQLLLL